jgi:hypothetical protein
VNAPRDKLLLDHLQSDLRKIASLLCLLLLKNHGDSSQSLAEA